MVNDTTMAFIGKNLDSSRLVTFDWKTMEYTLHSLQFKVSQSSSACAKLKGQNGVDLIAAAGSSYLPSGMEVWNPVEESTEIFTPEYPNAYAY